jgi:PadR family transcriptional regulator PadR
MAASLPAPPAMRSMRAPSRLSKRVAVARRLKLTTRRYLPIVCSVPRRKPGTLLPLETEILEVALSMLRSGKATFHGFGLAQTMREQSGSRSLTAHGTLYKALSRLEEFGLLTSRWEDAAAVEGRPRRRLYELTGEGARVAGSARAERAVAPVSRVTSEPA